MTHARTTLPTISPVQIAIAAHRTAYDAFQVAPEGDEALHAEDAYDEASMALVAVACTNASEALALFRHLAWWVLDEAEYASGHQPAYDIAMARARDPQEATVAKPGTPEAAPEAINLPELAYEPIRLHWRGTGNVVAFAGCAVLSLVAGRR